MPNGRHPEHDRLIERAAENRAIAAEEYTRRLEYLLIKAVTRLIKTGTALPDPVKEWWQSTGKYKHMA